MQRYAIYWAPKPDSALAALGRAWLGADPERGAAVAEAERNLFGLDPALVERATAAPRRYGLHATMKAPFRLAPDVSESELRAALDAFCARRRRFVTGPLKLARFDHWLALIPTRPLADLEWLAAESVVAFDHFRAVLTAEDRERRGAITDRVLARNLDEFGYPHILTAFQFHITLAGPVEAHELDAVEAALRPSVAPFTEGPFAVEDLCWFGEPDGGGLFKVTHRAGLVR